MNPGSEPRPEPTDWICESCNQELTPGKVSLMYMGSRFTVDMMRCPGCGMVFIPQSLAEGRMAEVEKILEDK